MKKLGAQGFMRLLKNIKLGSIGIFVIKNQRFSRDLGNNKFRFCGAKSKNIKVTIIKKLGTLGLFRYSQGFLGTPRLPQFNPKAHSQKVFADASTFREPLGRGFIAPVICFTNATPPHNRRLQGGRHLNFKVGFGRFTLQSKEMVMLIDFTLFELKIASAIFLSRTHSQKVELAKLLGIWKRQDQHILKLPGAERFLFFALKICYYLFFLI